MNMYRVAKNLIVIAGALLMFGCAGNARDLVVVAKGKTSAKVIVAANAGESEKLAASDLAKYIGLMTGVKVAVAGPDALRGRSPFLIVGQAALRAKPALKAKLKAVLKKNPLLRADAIVLWRQGKRVYLAGNNDESHYYAVAELLRRWGCRWYIATDFGECIPEKKTLRIGNLNYAYAPPFEIRSYWISWIGDYAGFREFKRRNRMTHGVGVPSGHAMGKYVKGLGKNAFNVPISDLATAEHVAKQIEARFAKGEYISMGMEDGLYTPMSEKDKKLMKLQWDKYFMRWSVADSFMEFYNNLATILLKKHPNSKSKIGFLAYANMTLPPVRKMTAAKPLVAYLAPIDIDPNHGMDHPDSPPRQEYKDMLYKWAKVMEGRVAIYDYDQGMLVWRDIPNPSHMAFRHDVKHYRKTGILGVATESRNAIGTTFLNLHIRGQLMWNPDVDVDKLLVEFYPKFYGPAAKPMAAYWGAIFKAWEQTIITEHEFFAIPAIYTPKLVATLKKHLAAAEKLTRRLSAKTNASRNEKLYLQRMRFTRLSFEILDSYTRMAKAVATDIDYKAAVAVGEKGLAAREKMTAMSGIFTTYKKYGERGYAWWPGEVQQYRELLAFTDGDKGKLVKKLPLEWAFRRDKQNAGLKKGYHTKQVDLSYWQDNADKQTLANRKDYPDKWEMVRTDLYIQAQGIRDPDRQSFTGYAWYRTDVKLKAREATGKIHLRFPGIFNEVWLYVNGKEVAHRDKYKPMWWHNDYRFEWDVPLAGKLRSGKNTITVRIHNPHHFGGMFRRPFLYAAKQ